MSQGYVTSDGDETSPSVYRPLQTETQGGPLSKYQMKTRVGKRQCIILRRNRLNQVAGATLTCRILEDWKVSSVLIDRNNSAAP
jgi:hypothetical protein